MVGNAPFSNGLQRSYVTVDRDTKDTRMSRGDVYEYVSVLMLDPSVFLLGDEAVGTMFPNPKLTPTLASVSMAQIITKLCRWMIQILRIQINSIPVEGFVSPVCVPIFFLSLPLKSTTVVQLVLKKRGAH